MPRNNFKCCHEVKSGFIHFHSKCDKARSAQIKTGAFLNQYIECTKLFEPRVKYQVCFNLMRQLSKKPRFEILRDKKIVLPSRITTREERSLKRQSIDIEPVLVDNAVLVNENIDKKVKFIDRVIECAAPYRKPFCELKLRKRLERIDDIACQIIASCIDKNKVQKHGTEYIMRNELFAHEVLNLFNGVRNRLERKLRMNLQEIEYPEVIELIDEDEEKVDNSIDNCLRKSFNDETVQVSYAIMGEATGRGYERIRKKYNDLPSTNTPLPSEYVLNQQLPIEIKAVKKTIVGVDGIDPEIKNEILLGIGNHDIVKSEEDAMVMFSEMSTESGASDTILIGAKLDGSYIDIINLMKCKHIAKGLTVPDGEDMIVINSFDGAEAFKTQKNVSSVVSFSSSLLTTSLIQERHLTAGASFNVCTWMQMMGKENFNMMKSVLDNDYWSSRKALIEGSKKINGLSSSKLWVYDVHDAKMLYSLLQHSQWNRKYKPFLVCKCKRDDGLDNDDHICKMFDDDSYKNLWERSLRRWDSKIERCNKYNISKHKDWCDESNDGVTHLGFQPDSLPISTIRFDVFHCSCAIIRSVMNYTRKVLMKQSITLRKDFTNDVLRLFWAKFHVYCWNNSLNFSSFKGDELSKFVKNSDSISHFLLDKTIPNDETRNLVGALTILRPIFKFMSITYIENESAYLKDLNHFKKNVRLLFKYGKDTFLAGGDVTFYFHCIRFYLPQLADLTFKRHKLGLGIFNMQGFERRNKESKNSLNRFATLNRKSDKLLVNNVRRLLNVFLHEINAY